MTAEANEDITLFDLLPPELVLVCISFLDTRSFGNLRCTSRSCRRLCDSALDQLLRYYWVMISTTNKRAMGLAKDMLFQATDRATEEHVGLLVKTLTEVGAHVNLRLNAGDQQEAGSPVALRLCKAFAHNLHTVYDVLDGLLRNEIPLTVNFGMLDLCLRRGFKELCVMLPLTVSDAAALMVPGIVYAEPEINYTPEERCSGGTLAVSTPDGATTLVYVGRKGNEPPTTDAISDPDARKAWERAFGKECLVSYLDFYQQVILTNWPCAQENPTFSSFFRFFMDFPRDGYISTFKWDTAMKQFGPFDQFFENFLAYGCERGFIGLVNSIDAERILHHQVGRYLIRFSRQEPERLTLSFCIKSSRGSRVYHRRKPHEVSIPQFLESYLHSKFSMKFSPMQQRLDPVVTDLENMLDFVTRSEYFLLS